MATRTIPMSLFTNSQLNSKCTVEDSALQMHWAGIAVELDEKMVVLRFNRAPRSL